MVKLVKRNSPSLPAFISVKLKVLTGFLLSVIPASQHVPSSYDHIQNLTNPTSLPDAHHISSSIAIFDIFEDTHHILSVLIFIEYPSLAIVESNHPLWQ